MALYLPNKGHPAYGVVRAIVADASDSGPGLFYLDSDGTLGSDLTKEARPRATQHAGRARKRLWMRPSAVDLAGTAVRG